MRGGDTIVALSSGPSTTSDSSECSASPKSPGRHVNSRVESPRTSLTNVCPASVTSSSPSSPHTTTARSVPSRARTCDNSGRSSARPTPNTWYAAPAGLQSGPSRLKIVGTASFCRTAATCFIERCNSGAKQKQIPNSSRHASTHATSASTFTPRAANTSEEPVRLVTRRLPCLATGTPAAAVTIAAAVLMLNVPEASPPVPHVSTRPERFVRIGVMWRRMAAAAPATSATVSPLDRSPVSNRAISVSLHSPRMMASMAAVISS